MFNDYGKIIKHMTLNQKYSSFYIAGWSMDDKDIAMAFSSTFGYWTTHYQLY